MFPLGSESPEVAQTGPLVAPAALPVLRTDQQQALQMAKRYCHDVTAKFVSPLLLVNGWVCCFSGHVTLVQ